MTSEIKNKRSKKGLFTGILIIAIGVLWLLREMDLNVPYWMFSWNTVLILIGVFMGIGNNFRKPASWILILIGSVFLINDIFNIPFEIREYFWPILVIIIGLIILIRPKREGKFKSYDFKNSFSYGNTADKANRLDLLSLFNGIKKSILSKEFLGGESVTVFGGTEINLLQADFSEPIEIEAVVVFGGLKLIIPPNWEVQSDVTSILAGVDDKRMSAIEVIHEDKILRLTGIVVFGGIDIVSY